MGPCPPPLLGGRLCAVASGQSPSVRGFCCMRTEVLPGYSRARAQPPVPPTRHSSLGRNTAGNHAVLLLAWLSGGDENLDHLVKLLPLRFPHLKFIFPAVIIDQNCVGRYCEITPVSSLASKLQPVTWVPTESSCLSSCIMRLSHRIIPSVLFVIRDFVV